ncbi:hypothetical protein K2X33_08140 [bacterium]|nr:hypothetical protein [bacterium]
MKNALAFLALGFVSIATASPEGDARYAFKSVLVAVENLQSENVHGPHVQKEMEKFFTSRSRFELAVGAYRAFREAVRVNPRVDFTDATAEKLAPLLDPTYAAGADSVVLAQVQRAGEEYQIALVGAVMNPPEIFYTKVLTVPNRFLLQSFTETVNIGLTELIQSLPYDATVIAREGYRVIIDHGGPTLKQGNRISAYTVENTEKGPELRESGVILIQRAEKNLSFGTVLVESKPLEVVKGNKVRFQNLGRLVVDTRPYQAMGDAGGPRDIASVPSASALEAQVAGSKWVHADLHLAGSLVGWDRTAAGTGTTSSASGFYPGASLRARVALTRDFFAEGGALFGMGGVGVQGSQMSQLRLVAGYNVPLGGILDSPLLQFRLGYSTTRFSVGEQPNQLAPSSVSFSGMLMGAGFNLPITESLSAGLEMNGLFVPSVEEGSGGTSGATLQSVAGWDFSVKGAYRLTPSVSLDARLVFQTHMAEFTGAGTRLIPVSNLSQSTKAFLGGVTAAF